MIFYREQKVKQQTPHKVQCDKCKRTYLVDPSYGDVFEVQEFHHIRFTGGYKSVFGDMADIECDLCQYCLNELVGDYCRVVGESG